MHPLRRAFPRLPSPNRLPQRRRHPLRPLRSCRDQKNFLARISTPASSHHVAIRRRPSRSHSRHARRRFHSHAAQPRISQRLHQGRRPQSHRLFQSSRPVRRRHHGPPFRLEETRHSLRRKRRRSPRRLRRRRRRWNGGPHLHAQRRSHGQPHRVRLLRRARHPCRWPHLRLRPQSRRTKRERVLEKRRLVRRLHHQRALPRRRQKNYGLRSCRATRMENSARHHLSHRRWCRTARHVEGLRRTRTTRLHRPRTPQHDQRPILRLRPHRQSLGRRPRHF